MAHPQKGYASCKWLIQRWDSPPKEGVTLLWKGEGIVAMETSRSPSPLAIVPVLVNAHVHPDFPRFIPARDLIKWIKQVVRFRRTLGSLPSLPREKEMVALGTGAWGSIVARPWELDSIPPGRATKVAFLEVLGGDETPLPPRGFPLSPHSPYALSPPLLQRIWRERRNSLKAIHLAESLEEVAFVRGENNAFEREIFPLAGRKPFPRPRARSPVEYLKALGCLDSKTIVVHGIFMDQRDVETLVQRGASLVMCPRSNLYLSGKTAPLPLLMEGGVPLALGTDGLGSTPSLSLWEEMRTLWFHARTQGWNLSPQEILSMATHGGARILNLESLSGLEVGREASFLVIRVPRDISPRELATFVLFQGDLHLEAIYIKGQRVF